MMLLMTSTFLMLGFSVKSVGKMKNLSLLTVDSLVTL
jgi:hypothetical protein